MTFCKIAAINTAYESFIDALFSHPREEDEGVVSSLSMFSASGSLKRNICEQGEMRLLCVQPDVLDLGLRK